MQNEHPSERQWLANACKFATPSDLRLVPMNPDSAQQQDPIFKLHLPLLLQAMAAPLPKHAKNMLAHQHSSPAIPWQAPEDWVLQPQNKLVSPTAKTPGTGMAHLLVQLAPDRPIPDVADQIGSRDAAEVTDKEPIGDCGEVELLGNVCVYMSTDSAIDKAIADHHTECAQRGKNWHPRQQQGNAQDRENAVANRVARLQAVAEPATQETPKHIGGVVECEESVSRQH